MQGATNKPAVVREFGEIGKYRIRLIEDGGKMILDIREYVKGMNYEGFTRRGVRFAVDQVKSLRQTLDAVIFAVGDGDLKRILKETP